MEIAKVKVSSVTAEVLEHKPIPRGLVGGTVSIEYADPVWETLSRTVVFRGAATRDILNAEDEVEIPWETVQTAGKSLMIGFYGTAEDGSLVVPTIWAQIGMIESAADPAGDISAEPTLEVWAQLQKMIGDPEELNTENKESLVAAINETLANSGAGVYILTDGEAPEDAPEEADVVIDPNGASDSGSVERLVVTVSEEGASHTVSEIAACAAAGGQVVLEYGKGLFMPLSWYDGAAAVFSGVASMGNADMTLFATVNENKTVSMRVESLGGNGILRVTINAETGLMSHSASEINTHVRGGGVVSMDGWQYRGEENGIAKFMMPSIDGNNIVLTFIAVNEDKTYSISYDGSANVVTSVNGKTRGVNLSAQDVGAIPNTTMAMKNPYKLTLTGAVTAEYDGSEAVSVEIPSGGTGSSGGNVSMWSEDIELSEEAAGVNITLPATFDKFAVLNFHFTLPGLAAPMSLYSVIANAEYKSWGSIPANASGTPGCNIYCLRWADDSLFASVTASTLTEDARPSYATTVMGHRNSNNIRFYSNTSGVNFPAGTVIEIWGVYSE